MTDQLDALIDKVDKIGKGVILAVLILARTVYNNQHDANKTMDDNIQSGLADLNFLIGLGNQQNP